MTIQRAAMQQFRPLALLALLATSAFSATAADERLDPVEISATRHQPVTHLAPRYDVQRSCPDYGEALKTSLARSLAGETLQDGEMLVSFELKGAEVAEVKTQGGPYSYRHPVRRAVRGFDCANDGQSNQKYMFQVVFRQDDGTDDTTQRIAVRSGLPLIALAKAD